MLAFFSSYAGDVSVTDAFAVLRQEADAVLVDVRTPEEWLNVGVPDLASLGKTPVNLSWRISPTMQVNPAFMQDFARHVQKLDTPVFMLCKVGGRSQEAAIAAAQAGYTRCYNIAGGFEHPQAGWKANHLPWRK